MLLCGKKPPPTSAGPESVTNQAFLAEKAPWLEVQHIAGRPWLGHPLAGTNVEAKLEL